MTKIVEPEQILADLQGQSRARDEESRQPITPKEDPIDSLRKAVASLRETVEYLIKVLEFSPLKQWQEDLIKTLHEMSTRSPVVNVTLPVPVPMIRKAVRGPNGLIESLIEVPATSPE